MGNKQHFPLPKNLFGEAVQNRGAVISQCKQYRYQLWRIWDANKPLLMFIMLNPSTADSENDDPTLRRCIGFANKFGFGGLYVCNLFAFRATDPKELLRRNRAGLDIIGPENDDFLTETAERCEEIVLAYGAGSPIPGRAAEVVLMFRYCLCLGKTSKGDPRHPLYLPYLTELQRF